MNPIPPLLTLVLPLIVTPLAGWLSHARLAQWLNTFIVLAVVLCAAAAWAVYVHSFTPNIIDDIVLLSGYIAALMAGPLKSLYSYTMLEWASPFSFLASRPAPIPRMAVQGLPASFYAGLGGDDEATNPTMPSVAMPRFSLPQKSAQQPGDQGSMPRLPDALGD